MTTSHATGDDSVLVDIGGDVGALVILTPPDLTGTEIALSPVDDGAARTHAAVQERSGPGAAMHAAVFPSLAAGAYTVWDALSPIVQVTITGGQVTRVLWPALRPTPAPA
ncbi:phospholipase [Streptacidiphilus sp. PB12-B1b]|uniref:phospholipase n=1 Tax=Streptacidiphilus sp. PB12-B1b TaxID=2705012 RepID=UPI0015FB10F0|nr:phospholipase [Streptacidiphilus sp. PB12-B1b]QMU77198.1 phospholipase [Streptacidiphilus sp. PB12-B1b]